MGGAQPWVSTRGLVQLSRYARRMTRMGFGYDAAHLRPCSARTRYIHSLGMASYLAS